MDTHKKKNKFNNILIEFPINAIKLFFFTNVFEFLKLYMENRRKKQKFLVKNDNKMIERNIC